MFQLSNYWALILLILIPYTFYLSRKSLTDLSSYRRWSTFAIRSFIILLFILSLAGFKLVWRSDRICAIFALDVSGSIPENEVQKALAFINRAIDNLKEDDEAGLIVFGKETDVEIPPKVKQQVTKISSEPSRQYTNLSATIKTAIDLFPQGAQKRLVLISDGNENIGNVLDEATMMAKPNNIQVYTVPLSTKATGSKEVLVDSLIGPGQVNLGRTYELKAVIRSNTDAKAIMRLLKDGNYLDQKEIDLKKGEKKVVTFQQVMETEGTHLYKVSVEPDVDTIRENNQAQALVTSAGRPKVLYVNSGESYLQQVLRNKGLDVFTINDPSAIPASLTELQDYEAIIFDNVPAYSLSPEQMRMIETYVHDVGGGFVMIGGENSFGSGGYHNTPIEKLMPVKMIPEQKKRSVSIVLLIDKSGSMTALSGRFSKIELAKESAMSVVDMLTDKDQMGVIAFDAEADEIVKLEKIQSKKQITDRIARMRARGGTNIYPALKIAYDRLKNADTQIKHVILLSDGRSLQMNESYNLVKMMVQDSITLSTVVISDEADKKAMQDVANIGSGRYYETKDAGNLPKLFIKETFMASKLIMEGNFRPIVSANSEIIKGINSLPSLRGYIATSAKYGASVILKSENSDPILATWQYGLGRSMAFTSDTRSKWAVEWLQWNDFSKFWSQAVGWCLPVSSSEFEVSASIVGGKGFLTVDAVSSTGQFRDFLEFQANVVRPDMSSETLSLKQSGTGRYETEFNAGVMGTYLINVTEMSNGKPVSSQNVGVTVSYSPEYSDLESNTKLLENLAEVTDGKFNPDATDISEHRMIASRRMQDVWKWLLIASIPLFFLDVALRRITISKEQIKELKTRFRMSSSIKPVENTTLASLKARKERTFEINTIQNLNVQPNLRSEKRVNPEPVKAYTSRLLEAKKRAGTN
jgi:uncharacterized membrane protein/secreted protein with Ig-like and vWFA domain